MAGALALAVYTPLLAVAAALVWRRPILALYAFLLGLAVHNAVMAALYRAGVGGSQLTAIQAWKETLLAVAGASVVLGVLRAGRLPFRPGAVDALALAFAGLAFVYALVPQDALGGDADGEAVLLGLRHALVPVGAYLIGRCLPLDTAELRRLGWTVLGVAASVAGLGLLEEYTVSIERWRSWGVPEYFREELGFEYHGPGGMPENFAFNTEDGLYRRLVSTFVSPLATSYLLVVALLLAAALEPFRRRPRATAALVLVCAAGLLFTFSRASIVAFAGGLVVLAVARGRAWPAAAAAATVALGIGFAAAYPTIAPTTHWFPSDLPFQEAQARAKGPLPEGSGLEGTISLEEPSIRSHLDSLRDGLETVFRHPQGFGLGNAGAVAARSDVPLRAGESNYTELGVETGIAGLAVWTAWQVGLLVLLVGTAWRSADAARRSAAAALAAALAAVLALGVQTDVYGVPWLAYGLWWLAAGVLPRAYEPAEPTISANSGSPRIASRSLSSRAFSR
jgi:hypothetical protein